MKEKQDMQKIYNIINEFAEKLSDDSDNEFIIEFAERNLKEIIDNVDYLIINLNRFTNNKSIKIAVYMYIFGLIIDYLHSDNSKTIDLMDAALILIVNLLSEANNKIKAEREISKGYKYVIDKYALDKLQNIQWHKYPEDKPKENGRYLVTRIKTSMEGSRKEVITHYYAGEFHDEDLTKTIAWAEKPSPYEEKV